MIRRCKTLMSAELEGIERELMLVSRKAHREAPGTTTNSNKEKAVAGSQRRAFSLGEKIPCTGR